MGLKRFNPAPAVLSGHSYRLTVFGSLYGQTTMNRFDYVADSTRAADDLARVGNDTMNFFQTQWLPCVTGDFILTKLKAEQLDDVARMPYFENFAAGTVGTRPGAADTSFIAAGFTRQTSLRGQHGRGSVRIAGISLTDIVGNGYVAGLKTLLQALSARWDVRIPNSVNPTLGWLPVVTVRFKQPAPPIPPVPNPLIQGTVIQDCEVQLTLSTQRSRRPRPVT
jgi:hypothetical protein